MKEGRRKLVATLTVAAMLGGQVVSPHLYAANGQSGDDGGQEGSHGGHQRTATPIKHVIVLIGENRTFDNVYATYVPRRGQHVSNPRYEILPFASVHRSGRHSVRRSHVGCCSPID